MSIQCNSVTELVEVCMQLTRNGFTYRADTGTMRVELTGGY